jgi:hypothetical protein
MCIFIVIDYESVLDGVLPYKQTATVSLRVRLRLQYKSLRF